MKKLNLLLLLSLFLLSCEPRKTVSQDRSAVESANQKMDRGDWNGAIAILNEEIAKFPLDLDLNLAKAVAYAGRAGIRTTEYISTFIVSVPDRPRKISAKNKKSIIRDWADTARLFDENLRRVEVLPILNRTQLKDAKIAQELLIKDPRKSSRLFRALLNLVIFRTFLTLVDDRLRNPEETYRTILVAEDCRQQMDKQKEPFIASLNRLAMVSDDLAIAFPAQSENWYKVSKDLRRWVEQFDKFIMNDFCLVQKILDRNGINRSEGPK